MSIDVCVDSPMAINYSESFFDNANGGKNALAENPFLIIYYSLSNDLKKFGFITSINRLSWS